MADKPASTRKKTKVATKKRDAPPIYLTVQIERHQGHPTRARFFTELERVLGRPVVSLVTSFMFPGSIEDNDAEMLEVALRTEDLSKGLALLISSPGGDGEAAERIIRICRSHSGTGEYWAIVPGKAKSAATMICFGASKIIMGPSSELGPVDPQIIYADEKGRRKQHSAYNLVTSYDNLFGRAVATKGRVEPFLQQLDNYDARDIQRYREVIELGDDIAVKALKAGMMSRKSDKAIRHQIERFLKPQRTRSHGRPIFRDEARDCGLAVEHADIGEGGWDLIYELYVRSNEYVSHEAVKCIETGKTSLHMPVPQAWRQ
jgi:ATP-dependent protease ClpP protease subunit